MDKVIPTVKYPYLKLDMVITFIGLGLTLKWASCSCGDVLRAGYGTSTEKKHDKFRPPPFSVHLFLFFGNSVSKFNFAALIIHSAQFAKWGSFEPIKINLILFPMLKTLYFSHLFFLFLFLPFVTFLDCNTNFLHVILLGFLWYME